MVPGGLMGASIGLMESQEQSRISAAFKEFPEGFRRYLKSQDHFGVLRVQVKVSKAFQGVLGVS